MRLIDADKLHYKKVCCDESYKLTVVVFAKEIDKARQIDAIPVEWLEEYCAENWAEYSSQFSAIRRMLEDWRKENEID